MRGEVARSILRRFPCLEARDVARYKRTTVGKGEKLERLEEKRKKKRGECDVFKAMERERNRERSVYVSRVRADATAASNTA